MYCTRCHNGSPVYKGIRSGELRICDRCGSELTNENPLPKSPTRSIRAMKRRTNRFTEPKGAN